MNAKPALPILPPPLNRPEDPRVAKRKHSGNRAGCAWVAVRRSVMAVLPLSLLLAGCLGLTGCFGLFKPDNLSERYFILTPVATVPPPATPSAPLALGVGQVKLPAYLSVHSLAVRQGTNEIVYLPASRWAERLDAGIQRVLAADLNVLTPADQIRLSAWPRDEVAAGVYVTIEQFDVDARGHAVLVAWWRVLSPDGGSQLRAGRSRYAHDGPAPEADPQGAVAGLSGLLGDLSGELAAAVREALARPQAKHD